MMKLLNRVPKLGANPIHIRHSKTVDEEVVISMDEKSAAKPRLNVEIRHLPKAGPENSANAATPTNLAIPTNGANQPNPSNQANDEERTGTPVEIPVDVIPAETTEEEVSGQSAVAASGVARSGVDGPPIYENTDTRSDYDSKDYQSVGGFDKYRKMNDEDEAEESVDKQNRAL